jgi:uncharacterized lipoprotein
MCHLILPALILITLSGCSGKNHRTATVSEFRDAHPYAKQIQNSPMPDGSTVQVYTDNYPRMDFGGNRVSYELQTFVITAKGDDVVDFANGVQLP